MLFLYSSTTCLGCFGGNIAALWENHVDNSTCILNGLSLNILREQTELHKTTDYSRCTLTTGVFRQPAKWNYSLHINNGSANSSTFKPSPNIPFLFCQCREFLLQRGSGKVQAARACASVSVMWLAHCSLAGCIPDQASSAFLSCKRNNSWWQSRHSLPAGSPEWLRIVKCSRVLAKSNCARCYIKWNLFISNTSITNYTFYQTFLIPPLE